MGKLGGGGLDGVSVGGRRTEADGRVAAGRTSRPLLLESTVDLSARTLSTYRGRAALQRRVSSRRASAREARISPAEIHKPQTPRKGKGIRRPPQQMFLLFMTQILQCNTDDKERLLGPAHKVFVFLDLILISPTSVNLPDAKLSSLEKARMKPLAFQVCEHK